MFSRIKVRFFVVTTGLCVLCSISALAQSAAPNDIHAVDFRNFRYYVWLGGEGSTKEAVKVTNGSYTKKTRDEGVTFKVNEVIYGDLNGDGLDEAVIMTVCNTGGTGWFDEGLLYTMRNGKPVLLLHIEGGDRANGSVRGVRIETGLLKVERHGSLSPGSAHGVDFTDTTSYRLSGSKLLRVGRPVRRSFRGGSQAKRIQFARGESSAVLTGTTSAADFYVLSAREKQTLTVRISSPLNNARFELIVDDATMAYRVTEWSGKLEYRSDYHIVVVSNNGSSDYKLEVSVR